MRVLSTDCLSVWSAKERRGGERAEWREKGATKKISLPLPLFAKLIRRRISLTNLHRTSNREKDSQVFDTEALLFGCRPRPTSPISHLSISFIESLRVKSCLSPTLWLWKLPHLGGESIRNDDSIQQHPQDDDSIDDWQRKEWKGRVVDHPIYPSFDGTSVK